MVTRSPAAGMLLSPIGALEMPFSFNTTARSNGMMLNVGRRYIPSPAIQYSEFWDALRSIWPGPSRPNEGPNNRIGIAVSGGLDSMALARLCIGPKNSGTKRFIDFHAFIVDHKARAGSTEEAKLVASRLQEWGLESTILTLQWPSEIGPAKLPNFESAARRLRYQALGKACRDKRIRSLLLAHHNDDQAETVLLRLVRGQGGFGLKSIQSSAEIPDCWGQHGVHQSGFREDNLLWRSTNDLDGSRKDQEEGRSVLDDRQVITKPPIYFEDGGIRIYRPLLKFSKDRLQSTCHHYRIQWVEDETNQDASRTPRNAVRQLLNSGKLPKALQKSSLLAVVERVQKRSADRMLHAGKLFHRTQILMFDPRAGMLIVRMPARVVPTERVSEAVLEGELKNYRFEASLFLRSLLEIVSPEEKISLQQLEFALCSIFPDLDDPEATAVDKRILPSNFTTQGVQFQRCISPIEGTDSRHIEDQEDLDPEFIWVLTRQPAWLLRYPTPSLPLIPISSAPNNFSPNSSSTFYPWHLFDGRFWIRVSHSSPQPLEIRLPKPTDIATLRESFRGTPQRPYVESRWKRAAPGKIRFTLPIIAEAGEGGRVLAMPTLGISAPGVKRELNLRWEVRYKKVDWKGKWVTMAGRRKGSGKQRFLEGGDRAEKRNSWSEESGGKRRSFR